MDRGVKELRDRLDKSIMEGVMGVEKLRAWVRKPERLMTDSVLDIILILVDVLEAEDAYKVVADKTIGGESIPVGELLYAYKVMVDKNTAAHKKIGKLKG